MPTERDSLTGNASRLINLGDDSVIVGGTLALDGSNPTDVVTGLASVKSLHLVLEFITAPGVGTSTLTYGVSGGTISIRAWKPTSTSNPTLVASTGTENVSWIAIGKV